MRLYSLDVLRGVAVLLVIGRHLPYDGVGWPSALEPARVLLDRVGWVGVDLFFVLSGFLVGGLLLEENRRHGSVRVGRFLIRRGYKIYPPFYIMLAIAALGSVLDRRIVLNPALPARFLHEALYLQSYLEHYWAHTWSLAVEEHFYLLLALGFAWRLRRPRGPDPFRGLAWLVPALSLATLAGRLERAHSLASSPEPAWVYMLQPTHLRIDTLGWGVLVAWLWHHHRAALLTWVAHRRIAIAVAAALLLAPPLCFEVVDSVAMMSFGVLALGMGFALLLILVLERSSAPVAAPGTAGKNRVGAAVAAVGRASYGIYLVHIPVRRIFDGPWNIAARPGTHSGGPEILLASALWVALAIAAGFLWTWAIERPALAIRDRRFPSRVPGTTSTASAGGATGPARGQ